MIEEDVKIRFNELLSDYLDLEDQKVHIRNSQKEIKEEMSEILSESKSIISKVISYIVKERNKGEGELERIYEIVEGLE